VVPVKEWGFNNKGTVVLKRGRSRLRMMAHVDASH